MSFTRQGSLLGLSYLRTIPPKEPAPWEAPVGVDAAGSYRIQVADANGCLIGTVLGRVEWCGWELNGVGRLRLTVPGTTDPRLIQPRNRIVIQFDNGLPLWGGFIDYPVDRSAGVIGLTAYGGEGLLAWRGVERGRYFRNATVGHIFESVLREASRPELMKIGAVWQGGEPHSPSYHYRSLAYIIGESVLRLEPCDYAVVPRLEGNKVVFYAELYRQRGRETDVVFHPATNASQVRPSDQGPIYTDVFVAGAGTGWSSASRIYSRATSAEAGRKHGLRERYELRSDVSVQGTLDSYAESVLEENSEPYTSIGLTALNAGRWGFSSWRIGDSVLVYDPQRHEHLRRRVVACEYDAGAGTCEVVVE